jgi:hypothetical protein
MSMITDVVPRSQGSVSPKRETSVHRSRVSSVIASIKLYIGVAAAILLFGVITVVIFASKTAAVLSRMHW